MGTSNGKTMKQYPWKFKLSWDGIRWWQSEAILHTDEYFYYFYWWNWLYKEDRYFGFEQIYYDGYHNVLGLWFITLSWSTQWTKPIK
jgi:hypothetical protein